MATTNKRKTATKTAVATPAEVKPVEKKPMVAREVDVHQYITVRSGFNGTLVYVSKRTGEKFLWNGFGDEQDIELIELKNAKASSKKFFENNWWLFSEEDSWVIDYLGVSQYYKNALTLENFDEVFSMTPSKIAERVAALSAGQKRSLAYRARQLVNEQAIDSNKVIAALEKALGVELVER